LPHGHAAIYAQRKRLAQVQSARKTWFFSKKPWRKYRAERDWDAALFETLFVRK
jgi:hypothetical protein